MFLPIPSSSSSSSSFLPLLMLLFRVAAAADTLPLSLWQPFTEESTSIWQSSFLDGTEGSTSLEVVEESLLLVVGHLEEKGTICKNDVYMY